MTWKFVIFCLAGLVYSLMAAAQVMPVALQTFVEAETGKKEWPKQVKDFYKANQYRPVWMNDAARLQQLVKLLEKAAELGLEPADYSIQSIRSIAINIPLVSTNKDSMMAEIRCTDAAIHFFNDVAYGNAAPALGFNGLNYAPDCYAIPSLLLDAVQKNRLAELAARLEPPTPAYTRLKNWLALYLDVKNDSSFKEIYISSLRADTNNKPLLIKLYQLGIIDTIEKKYTAAELKQKIKIAQHFLGWSGDGTMNEGTRTVLNIPLRTRITAVKRAMNTLRWLQCLQQKGPVVVVNIPSASLLLLDNGNVLLESKLVVGKRSTPTPVFTSLIHEVILYPYWNVPKSIAIRESLPSIKRNIKYLDDNNLQVLNAKGQLVNPYTINWQALDAGNFPYTLRQSTGCDNSLGLIKFNFQSLYGVYLHDTPWKVLFRLNKRYLSHGCMRLEKVKELGHFILKDNTQLLDSLMDQGCLLDQRPITVPATVKTPVCVLYNTAWFDSTGTVRFYDDVYNKFTN